MEFKVLRVFWVLRRFERIAGVRGNLGLTGHMRPQAGGPAFGGRKVSSRMFS